MKVPALFSFAAFTLCTAVAIGGCAKKTEEKKPGQPPAMITVTQAESRDVPVAEHSIGEADSITAPKVGAEVAGRITRVLVDIGDQVKKGQLLAEIDPGDYAADARRLEAQMLAQQKLAARHRDLFAKGFISSSRLEEIEAQNISIREQFARARKNLSRTRIVSPLDSRVDSRYVSPGDWVDIGKPVFQLATSQALRIRLPFPETVADRIRIGQRVRMTTPTAPNREISGAITQLKPMVGTASRSFDAIVEVSNPGDWRPGSSVDGEVVIEIHQAAVTVPEESVVLRPAGNVVYVIENGKAIQRVVGTGVKQDGYIEITDGVRAGESVAVDGAGYLTDKAEVAIRQSADPSARSDAQPEQPK